MSNVSEVFKNILVKEGNYNSEINQILNVISGNHDCKPYEQLCCFINFYFYEKFYFIKRRQFYLNENINRYDENYDTNDYFMFYNSLNDKVGIKEFIEREQIDKTLKRYELIGIIGICGETDSVKTTESNTDFVSILHVFDKIWLKRDILYINLITNRK